MQKKKASEPLDLVQVSRVHEDAEIVHRAATFYHWANVRKYPQLFVRFPGSKRLYVNKRAYRSMFYTEM